MMRLFEQIKQVCDKIVSGSETSEVAAQLGTIEQAISDWAFANGDNDCRLLKLTSNLRYYIETPCLTEHEKMIAAIAKTLLRTADYDLNIRYCPERVKRRNDDSINLCDKLRTVIKEPVEEQSDKPYDITVIMATYNQLELTKLCLDSVFEHTADVTCEIILIDNGSSDGTYEYFRNAPGIKLIRLDTNTGLLLALQIFFESGMGDGKFWMYMNNDVIVTPRWASNMLTCIRSDSRIAAVLPATNRTAPFVCVQPPFGLYDTTGIEAYGERFNRSNPNLWQDYAIFYGFVCLMRPSSRRVFGYYEDCFFFPFYYSDGDMILSQVKAGYRAVQAGDTYIHHFDGGHTVLQKRRQALAEGEKCFYDKYGFFPTDIEVNLPDSVAAGAAGAASTAGAADFLFLGSARIHALLQIQRICKIMGQTNAGYYAADTMEKLPLEQFGENVSFEAIDSWYDVDRIFDGKRFDTVIYLEDVMKLRNPKRFLAAVFNRLNTNGNFHFISENSGSLMAMEYIFTARRKSPRDSARLRKNSAYAPADLFKLLSEVGFEPRSAENNYYNEAYAYGRLSNAADYSALIRDEDMTAFHSGIKTPFRAISVRKPGTVDIENALGKILFGKKQS
jgi:GT2 family glycosyltransferase